MSAKKVRRHIRQLKKERRREERASRKAAASAAAPAPVEPAAEPAVEPVVERVAEPVSEPDTVEPAARRVRAVRPAAVLATLGVLAVAGGSIALDPRGESGEPAEIAAAAFPTADASAASVCPPMPGQADSLTTDGLLEYRERDDSAASRFQALVLPSEDGEAFPPAAWAQLGEQYRVNTTELTDPDAPAEHDAVYESLGAMTRTSFLELQGLPDGVAGTGAALYSYLADSGPVTGLAVGECTAPQRSQWFFGPELGGGATALLTLANPYDRPATVEVAGYDSEGRRGASGTRTLVVPAETVRTVNIAALAGSGSDLGISVEASGAPVAAQLQSSRAVGLTGQGIDFLPGLSAPDTQHVIPGVPVPASTEDEPAARPAELWIHAPGDSRATIELQVFGDDGLEILDGPAVFSVEPGEVDTIDLRGLDAGVYDVVVRSDEDTYVAVSSHGTEGGDPEDDDASIDFAWQAGARPLAAGSGALLPEVGADGQVTSEIRLTSLQAEAQVSYRLVDDSGELSAPEQVTVPAEGVAEIGAEDLEDAVAIIVEETDPGVYAALTARAGDGFSLTTVDLLGDPGQTVPVRLRH